MQPASITLPAIKAALERIRGDVQTPPDASIVIPVNVKADADLVLNILADITTYTGKYTVEVILVLNNYPEETPPASIETYSQNGIKVVAVPSVRVEGKAAPIAARIHGIREASSDYMLLFDADCRIANATALIDWYVEKLKEGYRAAYTHVDYYDYEPVLVIRARIFAHHASRWIKRVLLKVPTTRGSNYAIYRPSILKWWDEDYVAHDGNIGPVIKKFETDLAFSSARDLRVFTSGRLFNEEKSWRHLVWYLLFRLRYNVRVFKVQPGVAERTEKIREYE